MAKVSAIEKNNKRKRMVANQKNSRTEIKKIAEDEVSRGMLRELALSGLIPGLKKSSW